MMSMYLITKYGYFCDINFKMLIRLMIDNIILGHSPKIFI